MMFIRKLVAAACSFLAIGGANAAVTGFQLDNAADATGTVYGSTDTFNGAAALLNTINGTTASFYLETLDAGLYWREFDLVIDSVSDSDRSGTAFATLGGYTGVLVSSVDDDPAPNSLIDGQGWTYTFHFTGSIAGDSNTTLTLGGFGVGVGQDRIATVELQATAVPEPETYAMLLAGLGVMGFVGRRRSAK